MNATGTVAQLSGAPAPTGSFKAFCAGETDRGGNGAGTVSAQYTVQPAALTLAAQDAGRAFGDPNPACQVTPGGFVNGDTLATPGGSLACDFGGARTSSPIGDYPIRPSGLTSADYTITFKPGTLRVTARLTNVRRCALSTGRTATQCSARRRSHW